ncbi:MULTISPECIES: type II toxin-antitoxin system RelE/ParE family toxin [unclassified Serratia (in: enterobacteria)]|uniref:type II toxin-antitoxin system RelE/ParE family toxin n=1 Tax=unclassified Serratia (in: enterobacteria) TaxID=2647522 RepID=UPI00068EEAF9|nr:MULTISPECIES: type II toxin-antitoxin system RelE/ParE family toxin [unclassified Serratia (in: enterobacteria)]
MTVRFTTDAKVQFRKIRAYSQQRWGKEIADLYAQSIRTILTEMLDHHPSPGLAREELGPGIKSFPCESHMLYYRETSYGIEVLAVLHQTQEPLRHLQPNIPPAGDESPLTR